MGGEIQISNLIIINTRNQYRVFEPVTVNRSMSDAHASDVMKKLVLFMVCLSIAGSVVAGAQYLAVDLPQQNSVPQVPTNSGSLQEQDFDPGDTLLELLINDDGLQGL